MQGDTDQVFFGEGTGGSRSATIGGSAFLMATEKITAKAKAIAAHVLKVAADDVKFDDGIFSSPKTNQTMTIKDVARVAAKPDQLPKDMEAGLVATAVYNLKVENYPNGCHVCEVEIDEETGVVEILRYSVVDDVGTVHQSAAGARADHRRRRAGRRPDADGGHPVRRRWPDHHRLVHGLRHAARERPFERGDEEQSGADQDQSARRQGLRRGRLRRRAAGGGQRDRRCALGARRAPHRDAGDAGARLARDQGCAGGVIDLRRYA